MSSKSVTFRSAAYAIPPPDTAFIRMCREIENESKAIERKNAVGPHLPRNCVAATKYRVKQKPGILTRLLAHWRWITRD
ncbi:MAG: uncharacterized protein KVP18_002445 [Porospora cf. gigantea A]|uniref:uncharacterized protein n=1 Tax=Porospora cf. gigantea A TaxID=2853593 RepID=UPI00355A850E|nr:MAG: hypothetical protein KVP18_002445 [Porospora cf. gigantea A]